MNGLPTKTNGGVRVRSLDRVGEGSAVAPRPATAQLRRRPQAGEYCLSSS